jgi:hypothetical protein
MKMLLTKVAQMVVVAVVVVVVVDDRMDELKMKLVVLMEAFDQDLDRTSRNQYTRFRYAFVFTV